MTAGGYGDALIYYADHGPITAPGDRAASLTGLPADIAALGRAVWGLVLHPVAAGPLGLTLAPHRLGEQDLRYLPAMLARLRALDGRPLTEARPPERRLVGCCRDFAVLLCAILRQQGRPARARAGFATYFGPEIHMDHWICEYWRADEARWVMVDATLNPDDAPGAGGQWGFDPLDVPSDRFLVAGRAWRHCRAGAADPSRFGLPDETGLGYIGSQLVRDLAALNKRELLCWDTWALGHSAFTGLTGDDMALLDRVATATLAGNAGFAGLRALYQTEARLRVPSVIHSLDMAAGAHPLDAVELPAAVAD